MERPELLPTALYKIETHYHIFRGEVKYKQTHLSKCKSRQILALGLWFDSNGKQNKPLQGETKKLNKKTKKVLYIFPMPF